MAGSGERNNRTQRLVFISAQQVIFWRQYGLVPSALVPRLGNWMDFEKAHDSEQNLFVRPSVIGADVAFLDVT